MIRLAAIGVLVSVLGSYLATIDSLAQAGSQGALSGLSVCRAIKDPSDRLKCYDSLPLTNSIESDASAPVQVVVDRNLIAKWSSASNMQTRPFHANGPWELQWDTSKGYFSATLHRLSGNGPSVALLANGMAGGSSSSYQPTGGDFYIEFEAMQPWNAKVVSVPSSATSNAKAKSEEPLVAVSGDQSGLPPCDGPGSSKEIKH